MKKSLVNWIPWWWLLLLSLSEKYCSNCVCNCLAFSYLASHIDWRCLRCVSFCRWWKTEKHSCRSNVISMRSYPLQYPRSSNPLNPPPPLFLFSSSSPTENPRSFKKYPTSPSTHLQRPFPLVYVTRVCTVIYLSDWLGSKLKYFSKSDNKSNHHHVGAVTDAIWPGMVWTSKKKVKQKLIKMNQKVRNREIVAGWTLGVWAARAWSS